MVNTLSTLGINCLALILLCYGVNGLEGAYNIYATFVVIVALISFGAYTPFTSSNPAAHKLAISPYRAFNKWINTIARIVGIVVLVWFGKFVIVSFLLVTVFNMCVVELKLNKIAKEDVDSNGR